ncbi:hypothetical protein D3C76_987110 [compost metagenome]
MARFEPVPGHLGDIAVDETEAVGGILEDVAHGQLAGWREPSHVLQQGILREIGQSVNPVAKLQATGEPLKRKTSHQDPCDSHNDYETIRSNGHWQVPSP